jgi:threonine/homoserine/homoserine lactone efflux protein
MVGSLYAAYLAVTAVLVLSPGSTTAVVVRNTLTGGPRAGLVAALGAAVANCTHATLAGLGLWLVVGRWPAILSAVKLAGAAYLAWLGLRSLARAWPGRREARVALAADSPPIQSRSSFVEGLGVNLLNPAIITFYLAVVPTFVPPSPPRGYFAVLAASHVGMALACHAAWAFAFHTLRRIFATPHAYRTLELLTAGAMLWLSSRALSQL